MEVLHKRTAYLSPSINAIFCYKSMFILKDLVGQLSMSGLEAGKHVKTLGYSCCLCLDRYRDVGYIVKVGDSKGCLI